MPDKNTLNERKQDWFHMTPTDDFIDLMEQCEEDGWSWEEFLKKVEAHFTKVNPAINKGKTVKEDSVRQKCVDVNDNFVENDCPPIAMPFKKSSRVNWKERALRRRNKIKDG